MEVDATEEYGAEYSDPFAGMITNQEEFDKERAKRFEGDNRRRVNRGLEPDSEPNEIGRAGDP